MSYNGCYAALCCCTPLTVVCASVLAVMCGLQDWDFVLSHKVIAMRPIRKAPLGTLVCYRIARNIGEDLNLVDWQSGKKTTKLNSK